MNIGSVIKKLRRDRDITQEKFAEYMHVSPQAVSRWENGAAYPDIETIPAIATFFGVTTDLLLGVDEDTREQTVQEYLAKLKRLRSTGEKDRCFDLMREAKERFPGDFRILIRYAEELGTSPYEYPDGNLRMTQEEFNACQQEIISICNNIIEDCTDDEIRFDAINVLSMAYLELKDEKSAEREAMRLPTYLQGQEMALMHFYDWDTEEHIKYIQEHLETLTWSMWIWIRKAVWGQSDPEKKITLCRKALAIYEIMYEDGDYFLENCMIAQIWEKITDAYLEMGDMDSALEALEKEIDSEIAYMETSDNIKHTSMLFDRLTFSRDELSRGYTGTYAERVLDYLNRRATLTPVRDTERFKAQVERIKKYL